MRVEGRRPITSSFFGRSARSSRNSPGPFRSRASLLLFFCGRRRVSELIDLLACKVDCLRCGFRACRGRQVQGRRRVASRRGRSPRGRPFRCIDSHTRRRLVGAPAARLPRVGQREARSLLERRPAVPRCGEDVKNGSRPPTRAREAPRLLLFARLSRSSRVTSKWNRHDSQHPREVLVGRLEPRNHHRQHDAAARSQRR
jgi:hypothetical protein